MRIICYVLFWNVDAKEILEFIKKDGYPKETRMIMAYSRHALNWTQEGDKAFKDGMRAYAVERKKAKKAAEDAAAANNAR